ncbi:MAG: Crp/Fnr family transcriptional regulator [Spirochaetia bacterium]|nr:Crp/Fnr family transcriptional regulator [Spirochaetia bacterium]
MQVKRFDPFPGFLHGMANHRLVEKGAALFHEGDSYRGPFFVRAGRFKVYTLSECGKELIVSVFGENEWMAAPPVFLTGLEQYYHASAQALECAEIFELPVVAFRAALKQYPDFMFQFAGIVVKTTFAFQSRLKAVTLLSVQDRLEDFLRERGAAHEAIPLPLQKHEIAALLGTTPESVSRAIRNLMDLGKLTVDQNAYWLTPSGLHVTATSSAVL